LRRWRPQPWVAVAFLFFTPGAAFGTWAARVPAVQDRAGLSEGELGVALAGLMIGAWSGLPVGGALAARFGSRAALVGALLAFLPALTLVAFAGGALFATASLFAFGAANSCVDVAINVQGTHVERELGRPILSRLHAMFSVGALTAAAAAAGLAAADVPVTAHFAAVTLLLLPLSLLAVAATTDEPRALEGGPVVALPGRALLLPGLLAFFMVAAEDVANAWSAVYLRTVADTGAGVAAAGFAVYSAGMLVGRLWGDAVVARLGRRPTLLVGGVVATAGSLLAVAVPEPAVASAGLFALGLGLAPVFPVVYALVAHAEPARASVAIAAVTTVGYLGSVVGPPLVGGLAEAVGLRAAMLTVPVAAVAMTLLARRL
jgi:MFS family permease